MEGKERIPLAGQNACIQKPAGGKKVTLLPKKKGR